MKTTPHSSSTRPATALALAGSIALLLAGQPARAGVLTASDGAELDNFGSEVSLSGTIGLVGAHYNNEQGSAYVFRGLDTATGTMTQNVKLTASDGAAFDEFGSSVSLSGDQITIGAPAHDSYTGKAYTGTVSSVSTLDLGNAIRTIDGISFVSQDDWIIGQNSSMNQVTLNPGNTANVTFLGKVVYIGQNAGSNNNKLVIAGDLTANQINIGGPGTTGNTLQLGNGATTGTLSPGSVISNFGMLVFNRSDTVTQGTAFGSAPIGGIGGVTQAGSGTTILRAANTYSGATTVNAGTLLLDKSTTGSLSASSALVLGGGTFSILGKSGANVTAQTMASLAVNAPGSSLLIGPNGGTSTTLTITSNTVTRPAGGTVNFDTSAGTPTTALIAWNPVLTGGIIGGGFTMKDNGGTGFATISAGKVTRFTGGTVLTASNPSSATTNFRASTAGTITNTVPTPLLNSLTIDTTSGASVWNLGANVASVTTGGLLMTGASNFTIENGVLQSAAPNQDLIVNQYGAGILTISAAIAGGAPASLVKTGSGTLVLNGAQTYNSLTASAGTTSINGILGTAPGLAAVTVGAGASAKFGSVSQKLSSLSIGAGATVTFTSSPASFADSGDGKVPGLTDGLVGNAAVPEPGTIGLLLVGVLAACRTYRPRFLRLARL